MSASLDEHAQRCEITAMLGCPVCTLWLQGELARLKEIAEVSGFDISLAEEVMAGKEPK